MFATQSTATNTMRSLTSSTSTTKDPAAVFYHHQDDDGDLIDDDGDRLDDCYDLEEEEGDDIARYNLWFEEQQRIRQEREREQNAPREPAQANAAEIKAASAKTGVASALILPLKPTLPTKSPQMIPQPA